MRIGWVISILLSMLAGCSGDAEKKTPDASERSMAGVFVDAMVDELRGAPSQAALAELAEFSQAGVSFQYPAVLRATVDRDPYSSWSVERGEFELELHAPDHEIAAADFLDALVEVMAKPPMEGPLPGRTVHWCGQEITGAVYRFTFFGDPQIYEGFDLPAGSNGSRFLMFSDMRVSNDWSATAKAAFAAVDASIRCDAGHPQQSRSAH